MDQTLQDISIQVQKKGEKRDEFRAVLRREKSFDGGSMLEWEGFWFPEGVLQDVLSFLAKFHSRDSDILLVTIPKSGTTWLKALVFSILHRNVHKLDESPLLVSNPHEHVPFDFQLQHDLPENDVPLAFASHTPFQCLSESILNSKCKIIYVCRNPLDQFISLWSFAHKYAAEAENCLSLDEAFELFIEGKHWAGPFWEHILGYWNASINNPEKVLFLRYENMQQDAVPHVRKIAEFIGFPFLEDEEKNGLIEELKELCSFQNLSKMETNKTGEIHFESGYTIKKGSFFRKGEAGDWVNHLTPAMAARAKGVIEEKFAGSGLVFEL